MLVMMSTNNKLFAKVEETSSLGKKEAAAETGLGEETAHHLVDRWALLNLPRGILLGASGFVGIWTALK